MDEWIIKTPNPKCRLFFKIDLLADYAACVLETGDTFTHGWYFRDPACELLPPDEGTIKTPNPKCCLYWCLIEFIDWRYSQSCWYFRPLLWTVAPLPSLWPTCLRWWKLLRVYWTTRLTRSGFVHAGCISLAFSEKILECLLLRFGPLKSKVCLQKTKSCQKNFDLLFTR
jgi:hypothetical protein